MLFRHSTENEWNISQNFTSACAITIPWLHNGGAISLFFTLVGDISRRQVIFHVGR